MSVQKVEFSIAEEAVQFHVFDQFILAGQLRLSELPW